MGKKTDTITSKGLGKLSQMIATVLEGNDFIQASTNRVSRASNSYKDQIHKKIVPQKKQMKKAPQKKQIKKAPQKSKNPKPHLKNTKEQNKRQIPNRNPKRGSLKEKNNAPSLKPVCSNTLISECLKEIIWILVNQKRALKNSKPQTNCPNQLSMSTNNEKTMGQRPKFQKLENQFEINPTGKQFINGATKGMQEETIDAQAIIYYCKKVIMEIQCRPLEDIKVTRNPTKILFQGEMFEIDPERTIQSKTCIDQQFYKILVDIQTPDSECYFNISNFNYIYLVKGEIKGECPISENLDDHLHMAIQVNISKQEIDQRINEIEENFRLRKEMQLMKFNKIGHNYELTKEQKEDAFALTEKLTEILQSMNYFVELEPKTIIKNYTYQGRYEVIHSNYRIETSEELRILIRVSAKGKEQFYYFTNPELLPVFLSDIPSVIKNYVRAKNIGLTQQRVSLPNSYADEYIIADKYTRQSTDVLVFNKHRAIQGLEETLKESSFKFGSNLDQDYHVIWIISGQSERLTSEELKFINEQYNKGTGIFIWADNQPYYADANKLIRNLGFSFHLKGNYLGKKILNVSEKLERQKFDIFHPVASGFQTLYEGNTICYPSAVTEGFQVFAYNSNIFDPQPMSIYKEPTVNKGGIWIDTGFTKLYPCQHKDNREEVIRYFTNASLFIRKKDYI